MVGAGNYFKEGVGPKFGTHWNINLVAPVSSKDQ